MKYVEAAYQSEDDDESSNRRRYLRDHGWRRGRNVSTKR